MSNQKLGYDSQKNQGDTQKSAAPHKKIVLFHLKKTSGTSVYRHLRDAVRSELFAPWNSDFDTAKNYAVIGGHYDFRKIINLDSTNICFLRNPVERVISQYNYVQTLSELEIIQNRDAGATAMRSLTLENCLDSADPAVLNDVSNYYCKSFFGADYRATDVFSESGSLTAHAWTILGHIDFFGFTESFRASISELLCFLGLSQPKIFYKEKDIRFLNKSSRQIDSLEERHGLYDKIRSLNLDDIALYGNMLARRTSSQAIQPNAALGDFPQIEPGYKFHFQGRINPFENMLYQGWYDVEQGVWSRGSTADLAFVCTKHVNIISLDLEIPLHENLLFRTITIAVNENCKYTYYAIRSQRSIMIEQSRPDNLFVAIGESGLIRLNIHVGHLQASLCHLSITINKIFVPATHIDSGDDRELGFKLHHMEVA